MNSSSIRRSNTIKRKVAKELNCSVYALPYATDLFVPTAFCGYLLPEHAYPTFLSLKSIIKHYLSTRRANSTALIQVTDEIEGTWKHGLAVSAQIVRCTVNYLRTKLLDSDMNVVYNAVVILDAMVKNNGFRAHVSIGKPFVIKTLCHTALRCRDKSDLGGHAVTELIFDCIQGWGEGFINEQGTYPAFYQAYVHLRVKHGVVFERPLFDPSRVPILMQPKPLVLETEHISSEQDGPSSQADNQPFSRYSYSDMTPPNHPPPALPPRVTTPTAPDYCQHEAPNMINFDLIND